MTPKRPQLLTFVAVLVLSCALAFGTLWAWPRCENWLQIQGITLAQPNLLWLGALAFLLPLALPWSRTDLPKWQQFVQVLLRMSLVALLAFTVAGPRSLQEQPKRVQIIHLVDRSESVPDALLRAAEDGIVQSEIATRAWAKKQPFDPLRVAETQAPAVQVIAFDAHAVLLPWPPTGTDTESIPALTLARDADSGLQTDLAGALNAALATLDGHSVAHFVLWSDGVETRGDARRFTEALKRAGVQLHTPVLPPMPQPAEFVVERFELPAVVRSNVPFPVAIFVQTTAPCQVRCTLMATGSKVAPTQMNLAAGHARIALGELRLRDTGTAEIAAACQVLQGKDRFASNNAQRGRVVVRARPRLLYVEGRMNQAQYLTRALIDDFEVDAVPEDGLPRSLGELKHYAGIILSDVPRISARGVPLLTDGDMRNLDAFVRQGGGLLVIGGENSLGSGGYQNTYFDKVVLPVKMDVENTLESPTIAIMLAIDKSGSMQGQKIELAKEAARATAEALGEEDRIGIVAFDQEAKLAVRLQRAGNRFRIASDISHLQASGGTHIYPALELSYQQLLAIPAKIKHVIVMTDGQAPRQGIDTLIRQMRKSGITVSSVGVGSDVDRGLLEMIADRGGGRSYFTDRPETLPRIFVKETKLIAGESVIEQTVRAVRVAKGRIDLLQGVHIENAPALGGFLPTKVKPGAEEILRLNNGKPLLVRWRLGLGKVAVWTSDLKNRWAAKWLDFQGYSVLARQLSRDLLQEQLGAEVKVQLTREIERLRVAVDAVDEGEAYMQGLVAQADIQLPDGAHQHVALAEVAAGHYEATLPLTQLGPYDVYATLRASAETPVLASGRATAVHPYPDEHRLPDVHAAIAADLVAATGGQLNSKPAQWLDNRGQTHKDWLWLWPDLARACLVLLLVDVLLRRIRLGRAPRTKWYALRRAAK